MTSDTPRPKSLRAQHFMFAGVFRAWREVLEPDPPADAEPPTEADADTAAGDGEPAIGTTTNSETTERRRH